MKGPKGVDSRGNGNSEEKAWTTRVSSVGTPESGKEWIVEVRFECGEGRTYDQSRLSILQKRSENLVG